MTKKIIVLIDGENFLHKIEDVLASKNKWHGRISVLNINLKNLINDLCLKQSIKVTEIVYYAARVHFFKETPKKSTELINFQRWFKTNLEKQGVVYVIAGNIRHRVVNGKDVFQEKGVDVKIATDAVSKSCKKLVNTIIICSSDSDLQPTVTELKSNGTEVIYLGFKAKPNLGLIYTCDKTLLIPDEDIIRNI